MRLGVVTEKLVVFSGNTVVVVGKRSSFRKMTGCMASPSWKVYSILPSIWFEVLLQDKAKILYEKINPYSNIIHENYTGNKMIIIIIIIIINVLDYFDKLKCMETKLRLQCQFASYVKFDDLGCKFGLPGSFRRVFSCR